MRLSLNTIHLSNMNSRRDSGPRLFPSVIWICQTLFDGSCIYPKGPSQTDLLAHLRENLHRPLSSLTADSSVVSGAAQTVSRIPEICFMSDDSSPASLSSWLDHTFTVDTTSPLLRCESCKLLVHASE